MQVLLDMPSMFLFCSEVDIFSANPGPAQAYQIVFSTLSVQRSSRENPAESGGDMTFKVVKTRMFSDE